MFNQYPYLNLNDLNLDYLLNEIKSMYNEVTNFVSINAIKYADPIQWNITSQYEKNTVVIDPLTGTAYISVAAVPSGVTLTRTEYWTVVFDLRSFVVRAAKNFTTRYEEATTLTATFSTTAGQWLVWGDTLYIANVNITAGDSYVVGGNITRITIEEVKNTIMQLIADNYDAIVAMIGDLDNLTTTDKTTIVAAINELVNAISVTNTNIGNLTDLNTTDKTSVVAAINETFGIATANESKINNVGYVNVKDFGATGDGVTDDTSAFIAALATGKNVYVPTVKGESYIITSTLIFSTPEQTMYGDSMPVFSSSTYGALDFSGLDDVCIRTVKHNSIRNLNLRNDLANVNAVGVLSPLWESVGSAEIEIENCMFFGFHIAINTKGRHINIKDNMFMECDICVVLDYSTSVTDPTSIQGEIIGFRGVIINNNKMHSQNDKIFIRVNTGNLINALITDNVLDLGGRLLEVVTGATTKHCIFKGNVVSNSSKTIFTFADSDSFSYNLIDSNSFLFKDTNTSGYLVTEQNKIMTGNVISNNDIGRCNTPPIHIGGMVDCSIVNNHFINMNSTRAILMNANPALNLSNCVITNNVFNTANTSVDYFIRFDYSPTLTKCVIANNSGNWPTDCARPSYTDGGNNTIQSAYV